MCFVFIHVQIPFISTILVHIACVRFTFSRKMYLSSLNGLSIDWNILLISMCQLFVCVCVLSTKTLLSSYTVSSVWLGSFLLFFVCVCVCFPRFLCNLHASKKGGNLILLPSIVTSNHFFFFWPASISNIGGARVRVHVEGKRDPHFFCFFLVKYQHCVCICFVHLWFVSLFCSRLILHPMNRNILVFCD